MGLLGKLAGKVKGRLRGGSTSTPPVRETGGPVIKQAAALASIGCGAQELKERMDAGETVVIVDVRVAEQRRGGGLPGALPLPLAELGDRWKELSDADEIVCTCADGIDSLDAAKLLRERGLINATRLEGGLAAWIEAGGTLEATDED